MSNISDTSYHKFLTGETVDAQGSPTGADLNPLFKTFQTAINDNYSRIVGLNSANISAPDIVGITGNTINNQIQSLWLIMQSLPFSYIHGLPTTLGGYGITDAALATHTHGIAVTGDVSGSVTVDNTAPDSLVLTLPSISTPGTYAKVTIDAKGRVTVGASLVAADIPSITLAKVSDAGTAASKNTGNTAGNVPLLNASGLLDSAVLPPLVFTHTFVVASQAAMLALGAVVGDIAVRTDVSKTFVLQNTPASTLGNWIEMVGTANAVASVAGRIGVVVLTSSDVGLGNVTNESKTTMFAGSTFTGTTTGVNWVGKLNGKLISVQASAPSSPSTDDLWIDTTALLLKRWNSASWDTIGGSGGGAVSSVNSRTGAVVVTATDVGLANVTNESKTTMFANSTFTGTTTGVNWAGKLNGSLFTYSGSAPGSPTTGDLWVDTTVPVWKRWNGSTWDQVSAAAGAATWASITGKPTTFAGFGLTDNRIELAALGTANVGNSGRLMSVAGIAGVAEIASLTLTAGSATTSNVSVVLNGVAQSVAILSTDNTATLVATKLRAATYPGWTTGGSGTTVTFTRNVLGVMTDATYSQGSTTATGTMTTPTQGVDPTPDEVYECRRLGNGTYDWVQID